MNRSRYLLAAAVFLAVPSLAQAQSSSLFGNRGVTAGSGTLKNGVGANNGTQSSNYGGNGNVAGFTGNNASNQSGFATGAQANARMPGAGTGNFVGNRNSAAAGQGANGQGANRNGAGGRNSLSGGLSRMNSNRNRQNQNGGGNAASKSSPIRPTQVISFEPPAKTGEGIASSINSDIASAVAQGRIPGISVLADGAGNVTLNGHVATETDRRKAESLVRLEPGVRHIVNRITVQE
jgi:hypothetical protein